MPPMRPWIRLLAALATATTSALVGCGDALVGESYLGTPLVTLQGQVTVAPGTEEPANPRLSLFWLGYDTRELSRSALEQRVQVENRFPASFTMALFDPPPIGASPFDDPEQSVRIGIAFIAVYADVNENGVMNNDPRVAEGPDELIGASATHLMLHTDGPIPAGSSMAQFLGGAMEPGYHLMANIEASSSCSYSEGLECQGDSHIAKVPADTRLELTIQGDPRSLTLPRPAAFVDAMAEIEGGGEPRTVP
jgi:hypothetical protein